MYLGCGFSVEMVKNLDVFFDGIDCFQDGRIDVEFIGDKKIIVQIHCCCKKTLLQEPAKAFHCKGRI